jgi:hypothetical protein
MCLSWRAMRRSSGSVVVVSGIARGSVGSGACYDLLNCSCVVQLLLGRSLKPTLLKSLRGKNAEVNRHAGSL